MMTDQHVLAHGTYDARYSANTHSFFQPDRNEQFQPCSGIASVKVFGRRAIRDAARVKPDPIG